MGFRNMTMKTTLAALVVGVVALAACAPAASDATAVREMRVTMTDELRFVPDAVSVDAGDTVRFVVHNAGASDHEFLIGDDAAQARFCGRDGRRP